MAAIYVGGFIFILSLSHTQIYTQAVSGGSCRGMWRALLINSAASSNIVSSFRNSVLDELFLFLLLVYYLGVRIIEVECNDLMSTPKDREVK